MQRLRTLDFDAAAAARWARLLAGLKKKGTAIPIKDSLIAATALVHDLVRSAAEDLGVTMDDRSRLPMGCVIPSCVEWGRRATCHCAVGKSKEEVDIRESGRALRVEGECRGPVAARPPPRT